MFDGAVTQVARWTAIALQATALLGPTRIPALGVIYIALPAIGNRIEDDTVAIAGG